MVEGEKQELGNKQGLPANPRPRRCSPVPFYHTLCCQQRKPSRRSDSTQQLFISSQKSAFHSLSGNILLTTTANEPNKPIPSINDALPTNSLSLATTNRVRHGPSTATQLTTTSQSLIIRQNPPLTAPISPLTPHPYSHTAWPRTGSGCGYLPLQSPAVTLSPPPRKESSSESSTSCRTPRQTPPVSHTAPASWSTISTVT